MKFRILAGAYMLSAALALAVAVHVAAVLAVLRNDAEGMPLTRARPENPAAAILDRRPPTRASLRG
jgi:hypothetical protein